MLQTCFLEKRKSQAFGKQKKSSRETLLKRFVLHVPCCVASLLLFFFFRLPSFVVSFSVGVFVRCCFALVCVCVCVCVCVFVLACVLCCPFLVFLIWFLWGFCGVMCGLSVFALVCRFFRQGPKKEFPPSLFGSKPSSRWGDQYD